MAERADHSRDFYGSEDHPMANTDSAIIMALKREVGDLKRDLAKRDKKLDEAWKLLALHKDADYLEKRISELEADNTQMVEQMAKVQAVTAPLAGRVAELERQLAYFTDPHSAYDSSKGCPACEWKDGVITKLCWTHEVYQQAEKREAVLEEALRLLKEVPFQFEPLLQDLAEEHYLDDDVHEAFDKQLKEIRVFLKHRSKA